MKNYRISCVVPTLNSAHTLDATLLALRSQEGVTVEVLVADSGSTDGTLEICQRWGVPTIHVPPGNMYRAINAGLRQTTGEWLCYLNSDDLIYGDSLSRLLELGEDGRGGKVDLCYGDCDYLDRVGRFIYSFRSAEPAALLPLFRRRRMGFAQQTALYRRTLFTGLGGFDETLRFRADADLFIRALLAGYRFARLEGPPVACFRLHAGQFSNQGIAATEAEAERIFGRAELQPRWHDRLTTLKWQGENSLHYLIRILRASLLARRVRLPRTIETYDHR